MSIPRLEQVLVLFRPGLSQGRTGGIAAKLHLRNAGRTGTKLASRLGTLSKTRTSRCSTPGHHIAGSGKAILQGHTGAPLVGRIR